MRQLPVHELRVATAGDMGYIVDTWLKSYSSSPFALRIPRDIYWSRFGHRGLVDDLVTRATRAKLFVACLPSDPSYLYGWAARELNPRPLLHYVFVRHDFRRLGFGLKLAAFEPGVCPTLISHITPDFSRYLARGKPVTFVNPYHQQRGSHADQLREIHRANRNQLAGQGIRQGDATCTG